MDNNTGGRILIVDDDSHMRSALNLSLKKTGREGDIFPSAEEALKFLALQDAYSRNYFLILSDLNLPGISGISFLNEIKKIDSLRHIPFVIITAYGTVESAVSAMKSGASDYLLKPFDISDFETMLKNAEKFSASYAGEDGAGAGGSGGSSDFICESSAMKEIDSYIKAVAVSEATILITGESGTGKEVAAKRIHALSGRKGRFVGVNCSAIVSTLLESELFGHEKGAFTGAASLKKGKFEQAGGGTILLDEIAEMDKNLQSKILRILQEKTIDRVGGSEPVAATARVIAATNKEIEKAVSEGTFREDLFYRLNVIRLHLPPLRERKKDILPLAKYFMKLYAKKYFRNCKKISAEAEGYLLSLSYQGNIRELENIIERAVILAQKCEVLTIDHFRDFNLPLYNYNYNSAAIPAEAGIQESAEEPENVIPSPAVIPAEAVIQNNPPTLSIKEMEKKLIISALKETGGNRTRAAEKLGITSRTLRNKLKELDIHGK
jgi:DNA-binding NtrC family response regulator